MDKAALAAVVYIYIVTQEECARGLCMRLDVANMCDGGKIYIGKGKKRVSIGGPQTHGCTTTTTTTTATTAPIKKEH